MIKALKENNHLYIYISVLVIVVAILYQNRAVTIGFTLGAFIVYEIQKNDKWSRKKLCYIFLSFIVFIIFLAGFVKTDSSRGRILIYKLSWGILKDSFPVGVGANNFDVFYGCRQMNYFKSGNFTNKEFLLADNIKHVYNDYLEIIVEHGMLGVLGIIISLLIIWILILRALKISKSSNTLLNFACVQIIAIATASFFTFVLYRAHWQCLMLVSVLVVIYFNNFGYLRLVFLISCLLSLLLCFHHYGKFILNRSEYEQADVALHLYKAGYFEEANEIYKAIYPVLSDENDIAFHFTNSLLGAGAFQEAEILLKELILKDNNSNNLDLLANCYVKLKQIVPAEQTYLKAIYRAPNRFMSRYNLFMLYIEQNECLKAIDLGKKTLAMPVKVQSGMVDQYKLAINREIHKIADRSK